MGYFTFTIGNMKKIVIFESIHYTIKAEKALEATTIPFQIITTPKYISADCGMAVEAKAEYIEEISTILKNKAIEHKIYDKR